MATLQTYTAVVQKVVKNGHHGPYAVATVADFESVTFSLLSPIWMEEGEPEPGTYVILSDIQKKRSGWRAMRARFFRPSDDSSLNNQKPAIRNQQRAEK